MNLVLCLPQHCEILWACLCQMLQPSYNGPWGFASQWCSGPEGQTPSHSTGCSWWCTKIKELASKIGLSVAEGGGRTKKKKEKRKRTFSSKLIKSDSTKIQTSISVQGTKSQIITAFLSCSWRKIISCYCFDTSWLLSILDKHQHRGCHDCVWREIKLLHYMGAVHW